MPKQPTRSKRRAAGPAKRRSNVLVPVVLVVLAVAALGAAATTIARPRLLARPAATARQTTPVEPGASLPPAAGAPGGDPERTVIAADGGAVRLPVADLADGRAHFYTFQGESKSIHFFVLKSSDGVIRAAFDACDVCFPTKKGYRQEGDIMVCNNCDSRFPSVSINEVRGGCNPAPLERVVEGDELLMQASDIEAGASYF